MDICSNEYHIENAGGIGPDIWRNGPYIGGHLAFYFKLNSK